MNRIIQHLHNGKPCPCIEAGERLAEVKAECLAIEAAAENALEFCIPGTESYLDGHRTVGLFIRCELDDTTVDDDLRQHAVQQLRGAARELLSAADRLEVQP